MTTRLMVRVTEPDEFIWLETVIEATNDVRKAYRYAHRHYRSMRKAFDRAKVDLLMERHWKIRVTRRLTPRF